MEKHIYLILSRTGTLLSKAIIKIGHLEYAHASLSLSPTLTPMYSFGRIYPRFPFWGGFVEEDIHEGIFVMYDNIECMVLKVPVSKTQCKQIEDELKHFADTKTQYRYNFLGIVGAHVGIPVNREKTYFCSQFVSLVLQRSGVFPQNIDPALTSPEDLMEIKGAIKVYQGRIIDYIATKGERLDEIRTF